MQSNYFQLWVGKWPDTIDWTGAVMGTHVSATLYSLTRSVEYGTSSGSREAQRVENEINKYFAQSIAYFFGENAFAIMFQAYDDMLWVVLGWLESVKFMNWHNLHHFDGSKESFGWGSWHGMQFEAAFSHRARVFYDLASQGWDTKLCGGGMLWAPGGLPYKNAITNELYISASMAMYLYFKGDDIDSPFATSTTREKIGKPYDKKYLHNARDAYAWLKASNMTNSQGLYTDGFHISNIHSNGTTCDERNEMVYTYNQGVLLSGLRGLWQATGDTSYLDDGHTLIRAVIAATGFNGPHSRKWAGLGRAGIIEEACDSSGTCSQDGQTFKGIFFHHLTTFCEPLPRGEGVPGKTVGAGRDLAGLHRRSCKGYRGWVEWNARAAMRTRNEKGIMGSWWGASLRRDVDEEMDVFMPEGAVDYRNRGVEDQWWDGERNETGWHGPISYGEEVLMKTEADLRRLDQSQKPMPGASGSEKKDLNDRGRGRTVETQGSGIAVVRAMYEFMNLYSE